jgi:tetratricopeptide (TPR) repeat protein
MGSARGGDLGAAEREVDKLKELRAALENASQSYWAEQVEVQMLAASAWIAQERGEKERALKLMRSAADLEDSSAKHIAMENRLYPMRELLGDLLLEQQQPAPALTEYETSLVSTPDRLRGLYGAAKAAKAANQPEKATAYFRKLAEMTKDADADRVEISEAKASLMQREAAKARMSETAAGRTCPAAAKGITSMMRSILIAAVTGVLAAVPASYFLTALARQDRTVTPVGAAAIAAEAWPICSTMVAMAETPDWAALDPDFAAGKRALAAGEWEAAIKELTSAGLRDARNADIQNYLGYAYRRVRQLDPAMRHYQQALALNPRHRSAHEHLGEANLVQGDLAKAKEHLAALERICLVPCDEYDDLERAIATYTKTTKR